MIEAEPLALSEPELLILASGSPRRVELLARLEWPFTVRASGVGEEVDDESNPAAMVIHLAERKARAVGQTVGKGIIVGADTTVVVDGLILNKPFDGWDAHRMLRLLRGRVHNVWTGLCVLDAATGAVQTSAVSSQVWMRDYLDDEIEAYVATGEPLDKAGAYAIQGGAGIFVAHIDGCYTNVVGLPLCELSLLLRQHGFLSETPQPVCQLANGDRCPRLNTDS